jgi:hypothetical protein
MSDEELNNVKVALNEYFKLKEKFEEQLHINKQKIVNNTDLSNKEKRAEFLKIMPKCINCKKPSKKGTLFSITYFPETEEQDSHRIYKASCGYLQNPCNLNIEIRIGIHDDINYIINDIQKDITDIKRSIIIDKNKLLFGLISTETALDIFEEKKNYINTLTSLLEKYLDKWNNIFENREQKQELEVAILQSYENISSIKNNICKMNNENISHYANIAVDIYVNILQPLLTKIRNLKYKKNYVHFEDNNCVLVQQKYDISDILVTGYKNEVISFIVGEN